MPVPKIHRAVLLALTLALTSCHAQRPAPTAHVGDPAPAPVDPQIPSFDARVAGLTGGPAAQVEDYPRVPFPDDKATGASGFGEELPRGRVVLEENIPRAGDALLALPAPAPAASAPPPKVTGAPLYEALVERRFGLPDQGRARLKAQGFFVASDSTEDSYGRALHELYRSELPLYLSLDAILHPIYASHDRLLAALELHRLAPQTIALLDHLHESLGVLAAHYPRQQAADLDLYLTVARRLLHDDPTLLGHFGQEEAAAALVQRAMDAREVTDLEIFGRPRKVDFTAYKPRGHYAREEALKPYFRGAMWLSRMELNVVSRSCRSSHPDAVGCDDRETPREALLALTLADLTRRAGAEVSVAQLDRAWAVLAGAREDISINAMLDLQRQAGLDELAAPDTFERLKATIGDRFRRTTRIHYMPGSVGELPAIATFLGPRVVPDAAAIMKLSAPDVPGRHSLRAADLGFILGHDRALAHHAAPLTTFPTLRQQLDQGRGLLQGAPVTDDFYALWLDAIRKIAAPLVGAQPSFMGTDAYRDLRLNTALVAYSQLRHNNVLLTGEPYAVGGCTLPDAYVEPAPATYDALIAYAKRGGALMAELDPQDTLGARRHFAQTAYVLTVLRRIQDFELAGQPLPQAALDFMNLIVEILPGGSDGGPQFNGWYFDLFYAHPDDPAYYDSHPGMTGVNLIASTFTSVEDNEVSYLGTGGLQRGVFLIDVGGAPRLMVGPVSQGFERIEPLQGRQRLDDDDATPFDPLQRADRGRPAAPWAASYAIAPGELPALAIDCESTDKGLKVTLHSTSKLPGTVTVASLDHHRRPLKTVRQAVGARPTEILFKPIPGKGEDAYPIHPDGLQLRHGETVYNLLFDDLFDMTGQASVILGSMPAPAPPGDDEDPM